MSHGIVQFCSLAQSQPVPPALAFRIAHSTLLRLPSTIELRFAPATTAARLGRVVGAAGFRGAPPCCAFAAPADCGATLTPTGQARPSKVNCRLQSGRPIERPRDMPECARHPTRHTRDLQPTTKHHRQLPIRHPRQSGCCLSLLAPLPHTHTRAHAHAHAHAPNPACSSRHSTAGPEAAGRQQWSGRCPGTSGRPTLSHPHGRS